MSITHLARPEIAAMEPYSSARSEADASGILLNANELPWPLIEDPLAQDSLVESLNRYPEPQHAGLIQRLARTYKLAEDHVLLTRGSDDGIDLLVRVFCRAGRDSILDCPPSFGMYRVAAQAQGAAIINVNRTPGSLELDTSRILETVRGPSPPRIVFLTSPANPTGDLVGTGFLHQLLEASSGTSIVVVDEAYIEFTEAESFARLIDRNENLVVLRTLSKAYGSAALRCGALLAAPELIALLKRVMPPYPLATPVVNLALRLFEPPVPDLQRSLLEKIKRNKLRLTDLLSKQSFVKRMWPGEANFVMARVQEAASLVQHCARHGLTIRMFSGNPLLENCVRISVGRASDLEHLASVFEAFNDESPATRGAS